MYIDEMTKEDFKNVPRIDWNHEPIKFDSFVIIPTGEMHDSGFMCMEYCAAIEGEPIGIIGGVSDVANLDGIGGYGLNFKQSARTKVTEIKAWNIDCLPCGYVRVWCSGHNLIAGGCLSNFEVFTTRREKR